MLLAEAEEEWGVNIQDIFSPFFGVGLVEEEERIVKGDYVIVELEATLEDLYMDGTHKVTRIVLKVDLQCSRWYKKAKKVLCKFPQIRDQIYDEKANTVTITIVCCSPEKIRDNICYKGGGSIKNIEIKSAPPPPQAKKPKEKPEKKEEPIEPDEPNRLRNQVKRKKNQQHQLLCKCPMRLAFLTRKVIMAMVGAHAILVDHPTLISML